jgi:hypothetical protein
MMAMTTMSRTATRPIEVRRLAFRLLGWDSQ